MLDIPAFRLADIIQFIVGGVTNGAIYALVALGYHIIFSATRVINFAEGEQVVLGGLLGLFMLQNVQAPALIGIIVAVIASGLVGYAMEKLAVRPAYRSGDLATIIVTIGALIVIRNTHQAIWGEQSRPFPPFADAFPFSLLTPLFQSAAAGFFALTGAGFSAVFLWVVLLAIVAVVATQLFFGRTLFGKAMRACADNPTASQACGVNARTVTAAAFGISAMLAGAAGILAGPILYAGGSFGIEIGLKGFSGAIVGGLSTPLSCVLGGFIVGILEALGGGVISPGYKSVIAFGLMFVVLLFRPTGIFGEARGRRA